MFRKLLSLLGLRNLMRLPWELIGAVAGSPVPVLVALGRATDDLVVARVADASFPTPTALGAWLRDTLQQKRLQARQLEEARLITESRELLQQLGRLQQAQGAAARWLAITLVLGVLWIATLVWSLLGR